MTAQIIAQTPITTHPPQADYSPRTKAGRRANGYGRDGGSIVHAVGENKHAALCGTTPGQRSDWSVWPSPAITCPKCLKKIVQLEAAA